MRRARLAICAALQVAAKGATRVCSSMRSRSAVLSIAPHSEPVVEFMARAASSWLMREQELVHRLFEQACSGVSSVHGLDMVGCPPARGVPELFWGPKHRL